MPLQVVQYTPARLSSARYSQANTAGMAPTIVHWAFFVKKNLGFCAVSVSATIILTLQEERFILAERYN